MNKIIAILRDLRPEYDFLDQNDFIESGMIDSFDVLNLVTELEENFDIRIDGSDILPENFCSIKAIENLIEKSGGVL